MTAVLALNPQGERPEIVSRTPATRLDTLDNKTIYLVDGQFDNTGPFLLELGEWFNENYPTVTIKFAKWREPFVDDKKLCDEIKENGHAAILAVGLCSTCAPAIAVHQIELEADFGVPTVGVHTDAFHEIVNDVTLVNGMANLPRCYLPHPIAGLTRPQFRELIRGADSVTGGPFLDAIVQGLLTSVPVSDVKNADRVIPRTLKPASERDLHDYFLEQGWTDRLPIVLPTEDRVAQMLSGTSHAADEVVGRLAATSYREECILTVEKVAVNAVMAGARPEYLPVILALASSGDTARHSSSTSCASWAVVNGPIRNEIEMNSGIGALGPYNHANVTIGRAFGLLSQNGQGGSVPGFSYMGSQGNPLQYSNMCIPENEERSPWEPLHVQKGYQPDESVVTIMGTGWYQIWGTDVRVDTWRENFARSLRGMEPAMPPALLLDPIVAREFVDRAGFDTKRKLIDWLYNTAKLSAREYQDNREVRTWNVGKAEQGLEPWASKFKADPEEMIHMFDSADTINVIVVGGETQGTWRFVCGSHPSTYSVDDWR